MIVDTHVYLSRWPFRRLPDDEPEALVARLRRHGVAQAWASTFDGLFHKDVGAANARLVQDCRRHGPNLLAPFGSVNPKLPDWQEDLRRCQEEYKMPGIRLHPNFHGYTLDDPLFAELLRMACARGLIVQLAVQMEDDRVQYPLMKVLPVDLAPLAKVAVGIPKLRLMLLNGIRSVNRPALQSLLRVPGMRFEFAMLDGVGGVARLVEEVTAARVMFGSYTPFYNFESALLKMKEAGLAEAVARRINERNAREWGGRW